MPEGVAAVVNSLALCAIHHLAYDRNLMGIDPDGVVRIARRLRDERDGPMLREGLQHFHGRGIELPRTTSTGRIRFGSAHALMPSSAAPLEGVGPPRGAP